ncbi:MAG: ExbD/TolR family protein [Candidatus Binatia bacterium]
MIELNEDRALPAPTAQENWEERPVARLRRSRRRYDDPLVNLTSMVDVLSVLMFFLLSIYSGGGYLTILPSGLELPSSNVRATLTREIEIAVLKDRILVDRQPIADDPATFAANEDFMLPGLQAALASQNAAGATDAKITIEADRSTPFRLLKKVMYTADQVGFRRQSLAVHQVDG